MRPQANQTSGESGLYRRVWRWHFYAGLVCLPFLALMALTGALYLYQKPIESFVYARLYTVAPNSAPALDAQTLVAKALAAEPGQAVRYVAAPESGRSAEVGVRSAQGMISVYLDPASGRVLGHLRDDRKLMEVVKGLHSLQIAGTVANMWIEVVAGWAIVLVLSGVFLWWPRGRSGGVYTVRQRPAQRIWWRDLHAVVGIVAAAAILFLAVTGMPWSAVWGQQFSRLTNEWGIGTPQYRWGKPESSQTLDSLGDVPWTLQQAPLPQSSPHAGHGQAVQALAEHAAMAPSIGLNQALKIFGRQGLPQGTPVSLPSGPRGVYTAIYAPDDVRTERVVHLDRYSGAVLADVRFADYGIAGRLTEWGISLHTGRQFGWINQLVMLAGCIAIVLLVISAAVMWWKRRPRGRLAAPRRREGDRAAVGAMIVALLLGLLYPLLGASMLCALLIDAVVPQRWHERFHL